MSNTEIRSLARECIKGKIPKIFLPHLFVFIVTAITPVAMIFINTKLSTVTDLASTLFFVFSVGLADIHLSVARKSYFGFSDVFSAFNQFFVTLFTNLLANLFILLKTLLLIIPGIVESYSLALVNYVRADTPSLSPKEACARSRWLMEGNKADLFFLQLSFIPWFLLSLATLGIGFIYVIPYYHTSCAIFYNNLVKSDTTFANPADNSAPEI